MVAACVAFSPFRCLKMEEQAGAPIYQWADMVAGTSTGAIIAGLISSGKSAVEIEDLYIKLVFRYSLRAVCWPAVLWTPAFDKITASCSKKLWAIKRLKTATPQTGLDMMYAPLNPTWPPWRRSLFTCFNVNGKLKAPIRIFCCSHGSSPCRLPPTLRRLSVL